jgi:hypothetical protein
MKKLMPISLVLFFLVLILIEQVAAQQTIMPEAFDQVSVTGNIEVVLQQGAENKVELQVEGMPTDKIAVKVQRGVLRIRTLESWLYRDETIRVLLTYQELRGLQAAAGAQITAQEVIETAQFKVGSSSGGQIELDIQVDKLDGNASEGGILRLSGKAQSQDIQVSTGGQYHAFDLEVEHTYVRSNTGGQAEVVAQKLLEATANTGGTIVYKGTPKIRHIKTLLAGEVEAY